MNARVLVLAPPATAATALSDEALVAACATGDEAALAMLFDRHSTAIYRFISRMVGADSAEVDDLAQAAFIEIWRSAKRFQQRSRARVWMFGIAHNVTRAALRGRRRSRAAIDRLAATPTEGPRSMDDLLGDRRFVGRLATAMDRLSEGQRGAFVLCELEDMTGAEAAKVLDARPGTVGRWLCEARQILRVELEDLR